MSYQELLVYLDEQSQKFSNHHQNSPRNTLEAEKADKQFHHYQDNNDYANVMTRDEFRKLYFRADRSISK